jgi:hypothetical protein
VISYHSATLLSPFHPDLARFQISATELRPFRGILRQFCDHSVTILAGGQVRGRGTPGAMLRSGCAGSLLGPDVRKAGVATDRRRCEGDRPSKQWGRPAVLLRLWRAGGCEKGLLRDCVPLGMTHARSLRVGAVQPTDPTAGAEYVKQPAVSATALLLDCVLVPMSDRRSGRFVRHPLVRGQLGRQGRTPAGWTHSLPYERINAQARRVGDFANRPVRVLPSTASIERHTRAPQEQRSSPTGSPDRTSSGRSPAS